MRYDYNDYYNRDEQKEYIEWIKDMGGKRFHSMNAMIIEKDGFIFFYSYRTLICKVYPFPSCLVKIDADFDTFSRTTIKQLGRFLKEFTAIDYLSVKQAYKEMSYESPDYGLIGPETTGEVMNVTAIGNDVTYNPVMFF